VLITLMAALLTAAEKLSDVVAEEFLVSLD
jgi:hypothetical protein